MDSMNYAVCEVEFEGGAQYSILCSSWLIRPKYDDTAQTYCLWPCKKELSSVLAKYRCVPDEDFWIRYKCKVLKEYHEYETAMILLDSLKVSNSNMTFVVTKAAPRSFTPTIEDLEMSLESDLIDSVQFDSVCSASVDQIRNGSSYKFPLQTPSDVAEIEENQLNVSKSNHLIIKIRLLHCGSKKLCKTVTSMLQIIFSDECAQHYTFDGNNNSKIAFNKLTICSIIIDSALSFHKDKTKDDVTLAIQKWLILASIRIRNADNFRKLVEKSKRQLIIEDYTSKT